MLRVEYLLPEDVGMAAVLREFAQCMKEASQVTGRR